MGKTAKQKQVQRARQPKRKAKYNRGAYQGSLKTKIAPLAFKLLQGIR